MRRGGVSLRWWRSTAPARRRIPGVWRDLAIRRRRTEVDVQIAPIAEIGARHGIDCRATRKLVAMIHEVEEGRRANDRRQSTGTGHGSIER